MRQARDAWKGLKWLVAALYEARRSSPSALGGVSISDQETGIEIQFPPDLPDQAYIRIVQIDSPSAHHAAARRVTGFLANRDVLAPQAGRAVVAFTGLPVPHGRHTTSPSARR